MLNVKKTYILHFSPLVERKQRLVGVLRQEKINGYWIEKEPTTKEISLLYSEQENQWEAKINKMKIFSPKRKLNYAEISLNYKHIKAYEDIVKNNLDTALILEDDVILEDNFSEKFNKQLEMTPPDWDVIFIGSGCNLKIPSEQIKKGTTAYLKEHPASKCSDSYIIKKSSAEKFLNNIIPFTFPTDFELNYQMLIHNMKVYWWEPSITKQGSETGLFKTSLR
jgi:GR25 family glycosyltransferase involved in LPS biosynthesis